MRTDLPEPTDILEELAEKTAADIDRLAQLGFDRSLQEMTNYHRFLFGLSMSQASDGSTFSFAEVAEGTWNVPHTAWIRQYRRLFERAASRLPDDDHFVRSLAYVPDTLLPRSDSFELPHGVKSAILRLVPSLVHCLENWITKRTVIDTPQDEAATPRLTLAGSDAKAYANVLPEIIGAWEALLKFGPLTLGLRSLSEKSEAARWTSYRSSWPLIWDHLTYTAYCLAIAVWNEDQLGATAFQEALVDWPDNLEHRFRNRAQLRHRRLLYPSLLQLEWQDARTRASALSFDYLPGPSPDELFSSIVEGAHADVVLLTAALFLFWTMTDKQASAIGGQTARSLLKREGGNHLERGHKFQAPAFHSLFLDFVRIRVSGERFSDGSYAAYLDGLVELLDNMTERRVVPGRVYSPSTMHGRHDLLLAVVAILAAATPGDGDDGLLDRITALSREEGLLPNQDESLRQILQELESWCSVLDNPLPTVIEGIRIQDPNREADHASANLTAIIKAAEARIEAERHRRLSALPIDLTKLEHIRTKIQDAVLAQPIEVPFCSGGRLICTRMEESVEHRYTRFAGISKGQLTDPPMESLALNLDAILISGTIRWVQQQAWRELRQRQYSTLSVESDVDSELFWKRVVLLAGEVGPEPVLIVSQSVEEQSLRRMLRAPPNDRLDLKIEEVPQEKDTAAYIVTISDVHVYGADLPPGRAWLLPSTAILNVYCVELDQPGHYVEIAYEEAEEQKGALRVSIRLHFEWSEGTIYDLHIGRSPVQRQAL